ncbi:MAG: restriction endonuclease subunit S [Spirochaetia bacterium]|nr:restriction endonuclease subunit S [Spirochaetia bacterium]
MKQTEVGLIPNDWEVKKLGDLFEMKAGGDVDKNHFSPYKNNIFKYKIFSNGLGNEGIYGYTDFPKYKGNAITITGRGTVGVSMYRKEDFDAVIRLLVLNSKHEKLTDNFFISELINSTVKFPNESTGVPQLTVPQIKDIQIPLPPLAEQRQIAKALSDVDSVINTLEKLIEKKKNIKQGTMQQLLTSKKRLPSFATTTATKQTELGEIPADWEMKKCYDLEIRNGEMLKSADYKVGNVPVIAGGKKPAGYHNKFNRTGKTITISGSGANAGYISYYSIPIFASDCSTINEQEGFSIDYLYYSLFFKQDKIYKCQAGGAQPHIHEKDIKDISFLVPNNILEQTAIAIVLSSMDKEIETLNTKLEKYCNLKIAMMQQLLTGKIRLISSKANEALFEKKQHTTNPAFKRSVLAAEIVNRLYNESTFGHVKLQKLIFLAEKICGIDIDSSYHRDAAGPYDNYGMRSIDSQLKKQKWFSAEFTGSGYHYNPLEKQGGHKKYFERYFADKKDTFDLIIQTFKPLKTEQCEIIATLYSAWEDFLKKGVNPNDEQIITDVLTNWHESKKRIPKYRWINALSWMKNKNFIPT